MSQIIHEGFDNFSGLIRTLYLVKVSEAPSITVKNFQVTEFLSPDGLVGDTKIRLFYFDAVDFIMDTLQFKEEQVIIAGDDAFKKTITGAIPRDRLGVFRILKDYHNQRVIVVARDRNLNAITFGTKTEPAVLTFKRGTGPTAEERNQYDLVISHTSREPAAYTEVV